MMRGAEGTTAGPTLSSVGVSRYFLLDQSRTLELAERLGMVDVALLECVRVIVSSMDANDGCRDVHL